MRDIDKISEKVEKRKKQLQPLFTKDKENYDLWVGKEMIFDTHPMSVNITGTEMTSLSRRTQSSITRSRKDIHVWTPKPLENPDAVKTANQEERMYYHGFNMADERLVTIGETPLLPATSWQTAVLGRTAVRVLVYKRPKTDEIIWNYLPLNPAFLTFAFDDEGLAWACYETFRSSESIEAEYGKKDITEETQGKGISVSDYWDRDDNVTYLTKAEETLKARKNKSGEVPIIIQPVAGGPKAIDNEGLLVTQWGQSVFDHVKVPFRNLNKMRSIVATQAHLIAKAPLDVPYEGEKPNLEAEHFDYYPGAVLEHPNTYTIGPLKVADIPPSMMAVIGDLSSGIDRATYTALNPDKPAHSGTGLRILGQDKKDFEIPEIATMNTLYTRICRMVKKQIIAQNLSIPVKTVVNGEYQVYEMAPDKLDNDFHVEAEFVSQDAYDEVEALQEAQLFQQNGWMCKEDIMDTKLRIQDVPAQIAKMKIDGIEAAIPELGIPEVIIAYKEKGDALSLDKAKILEEKLFLLEAEQRNAVIPPEGAPGGQTASRTPVSSGGAPPPMPGGPT